MKQIPSTLLFALFAGSLMIAPASSVFAEEAKAEVAATVETVKEKAADAAGKTVDKAADKKKKNAEEPECD